MPREGFSTEILARLGPPDLKSSGLHSSGLLGQADLVLSTPAIGEEGMEGVNPHDRLIIAKLREDPHVTRVIPPRTEYDLEQKLAKYDFVAAYGENADTITGLCAELLAYKKGPVIFLDFYDSDRMVKVEKAQEGFVSPDRQWRAKKRDELAKEGLNFEQFYIRNKLRADAMQVPLGFIDILAKRLIPDMPKDIGEAHQKIFSMFRSNTRVVDADGSVVVLDIDALDRKDTVLLEWLNEKIASGQLREVSQRAWDFMEDKERFDAVMAMDELIEKTINFICSQRTAAQVL